MSKSKYEALGDFLKKQRGDRVVMSFARIERIIGAKLPSAAKCRTWWSDNSANAVMARVWLNAAFAIEQADVVAQRLVFQRVHHVGVSSESGRSRHPLHGALKGLIRVMPGTDLIAPAEADWGEIT